MARLSLSPILWGHWKGLTERTYVGGDLVKTARDTKTRILVTVLPITAGAVVAWAPLKAQIPVESVVGLALTWSALVSAGLIGTFAVLAGWRARLSERARSDGYYQTVTQPVVALVDEAVAHTLMGILDALLTAIFAVGCAAMQWPWHRYLLAIAVIFASHAALLFVIISTRLYSAYVQVEKIGDEVNGFIGAG
jgi:hypothetical protein